MQIRTKLLLPFIVSSLLGASATAQTLTEFVLPEGSRPGRIAAGPDGSLWFTDFSDPPRIGRMTPAGDVALFPSGAREGFSPFDITVGADGNAWVTYVHFNDDGSINRMTPSGEHTEFLSNSGSIWITAGPDGNLWISQFIGAIARMTTAGRITDFPLPNAVPGDITVGPDGNLWFTHHDQTRIGRITLAGAVTGPFLVPARPARITSGPDGNLWFTEWDGNRIGRMTTSGTVTEFAIPGSAYDLVAGPDGNVWFSYFRGGNRIGRLTTDGTLLEDIPIPEPTSSLTVGADGNVWFTQSSAGKIGRIALAHEPAIDSRILPVVGSAPGVGGSFFRTSVQLHNSTSSSISGRIVFHSSGISGNASDPALHYSLAPGQTQSIPDLLPAMGRSGLGSADIEATSGSVPSVTARVFNDAGAAGTTGFTEELMRSDEALQPGQSGVLLIPADVTRFRFNLGVRTLEGGVTATLTVRDAGGAVVATVSRAFSATYHEQQSAAAFLGVPTLPSGSSISIAVTSGAVIFYGATVDNTTGDPSLQIARAAPQ